MCEEPGNHILGKEVHFRLSTFYSLSGGGQVNHGRMVRTSSWMDNSSDTPPFPTGKLRRFNARAVDPFWNCSSISLNKALLVRESNCATPMADQTPQCLCFGEQTFFNVPRRS